VELFWLYTKIVLSILRYQLAATINIYSYRSLNRFHIRFVVTVTMTITEEVTMTITEVTMTITEVTKYIL
jgi:alpha-N-acetylglucosamine transferase